MSIVKIKDKTFETSISAEEIAKRVKELAQQLSKDFEGKNPLFLAVLNGSFIFAADLMREITIPCEISFVKLASYQGTTSTGKIKEVIGINEAGKVSLSIKKASEPDPASAAQRPRRQPRRSAPNVWQGQAKKPSTENMSFEDMMARFKQVSDEKMTDLKHAGESKHGGGYSRRGKGNN